MALKILLWKNLTAELYYLWKTILEILIIIIVFILIIWDPSKRSIDYLFERDEKIKIYQSVTVEDLSILKRNTHADVQVDQLALLYAPINDYIKTLIEDVCKTLKIKESIGFKSAYDLELKFDARKHLAGVIFENDINDASKDKLVMSIRFPSTFRTVKPSNLRKLFWVTRCSGVISSDEGGSRKDAQADLYIREGFLQIQHNIFLQWAATLPIDSDTTFELRAMIHKADNYGCTDATGSNILSFLYSFCFLYPFLNLITRYGIERENNILEYHLMFGFKLCAHWWAHFIVAFMHFTILNIIIILILKVPNLFEGGPLGYLTNIWMLLLFLSLYSIALIVTAMTMVCLLIDSTISVLFGLFMWLASYSMFTIILEPSRSLPLGWVIFSYLVFFNNALVNGLRLLSPVTMTDFTIHSYALYFGLLGNILLHLALMWHFQHFRPGRYVSRKPYNFLMLRSIYNCILMRKKEVQNSVAIVERSPSWHNFENPPIDCDTVVKFVNVCTFHDAQRKRTHLQKISLRAFRGEITALLGHRGSGKTSILCIMAGFKEPDAGKVTINDSNVYEDWETTREFVDFCMKDNALFVFLTVRETLHYFITIKTKIKDSEMIQFETQKWLDYLQIALPRRDVSVGYLDFNQIRLLYLCCALCCETQVVLLDEPTIRMGFLERQLFWDIVRQEKPNRAIIVATSSIDEAELVADRIGVLNNGVLNAYGTSFFLKTKFGVGYDLIILIEPRANVEGITAIVSKYFPRITPENQIGNQLFYKLPAKGAPLFQRMLIDLEKQTSELDIKSLKLIGNELSEVYMTFGMRKYRQVLPEGEGSHRHHVNLLEKGKLLSSQIQAMFFKRITHQAPNVIPIVMIFVTLILMFLISAMSNVLSVIHPSHEPINLGMSKSEKSLDLVAEFNSAERCKYVEVVGFHSRNFFEDSFARSRVFDKDSFKCGTGANYENHIKKLRTSRDQYGSVEAGDELTFTAWYNQRIFHMAPVALNLAHNLVMSKTDPKYVISVMNDPLPIPLQSKINLSEIEMAHVVLPITIGIIMPLTISCFIFQLVEERKNHLVMLYKISGLNLAVYWFTTLIWDLFTFVTYASIFLLVLALVTIEGFHMSSKLIIFVLLLVYAFPALTFTYLLSMFFYKSEFYSYLVVINIHILTGLTLYVFHWDVLNAFYIFYYFALIFPNYSLLDGVSNVYTDSKVHEFCQNRCDSINDCTEQNICNRIPECCPGSLFRFEDTGIVVNIVSMLLSGVLYLITISFIELYRSDHIFPQSRRLKQLHSAVYPYDDYEVAEVKKKIADYDLSDCKKAFYLVDQVENKVPRRANALQTISFELPKGFCLAIYGARNCGKTNLVRQLIGELGFTFGDIYVKGYEFKYETKKCYKLMGYCPQDGGLYSALSGREFLHVMAMVRGVPKNEIAEKVRELTMALDMRNVMNKKVQMYSPEDRRKLNIAVALLLFKDVIILDEPTTGLDSLTRRIIWNVLRYARFCGKAIIFTTVDSVECEALADQVILFDRGEMLAIGSIQHLRQKFTRGFYLEVKLNRDGNTADETKENLHKDIENLIRFVNFLNEDSEMRSQIGNLIRFYCPVRNVIFSYLYGSLEKNRRRLNIASYTVNQGSMDNVVQNIIETRLHREKYML